MDFNTIIQKYEAICSLSMNKQLKKAIDLFNAWIDEVHAFEFKNSLDEQRLNYYYLLNYHVDGVVDPKRQIVYDNILKSILKLADKMKNSCLRKGAVYQRLGSDFERFDVIVRNESFIEDASKQLSFIDIFSDENSVLNDNLRSDIFHYFWLSDYLSETQISFCKQVYKAEQISWVDKALIVSSLTLSLLRFFDISKFNVLFDFFEYQQEQVWQRAVTGIVLGMYLYDNRLCLYQDLFVRVESGEHREIFEKSIKNIAIQLIKTLDTENLQKRIKDEILPEVSKFTPEIIKKLDLDNILGENLYDEDKNPEWSNIFADSPKLFEKMGQLSQMQLDGNDVFMGTFSQLKNFGFFTSYHNWFMPFYESNSVALKMMDDEKFDSRKFVDAFAKVPFFCNSDKYSFCLNIKNMPFAQKNLIAGLFMSEIAAMNEISDDEKSTRVGIKDRYVFTQYIQDLYRFYKLKHREVVSKDIFTSKFDFYNSYFFKRLVTDKSVTVEIATFYFEKNLYFDSLDAFLIINNKGEADYEIFQKIAFCYQKNGNYSRALDFYLKAELFDQNKSWNMKKIANCYLKLEKPDKALLYYAQAERIEPDNLKIQADMGRCHIALGNYTEALKYYYKVEYLAPENIKVQRPLAWCLFMTKKYEKAIKYFEKIAEKENNPNDYINLGHVELCLNNKNKAVDNYVKAIDILGISSLFDQEINKDLTVLAQHEIDIEELYLIWDYAKFKSTCE